MPITILDALPFLPRPHGSAPLAATLSAPDGSVVAVKQFQIVVWASLAPQWQRNFDPNARPFPAILDTGTSHNFLIREDHLRRWATWAGFDPLTLPPIPPGLTVATTPPVLLPRLPCNLWLHCNRPGERDAFDGRTFCLHLDGIGYHPDQLAQQSTQPIVGPRLPLIGLRAFRLNKLHLLIRFDTNDVMLWSP